MREFLLNFAPRNKILSIIDSLKDTSPKKMAPSKSFPGFLFSLKTARLLNLVFAKLTFLANCAPKNSASFSKDTFMKLASSSKRVFQKLATSLNWTWLNVAYWNPAYLNIASSSKKAFLNSQFFFETYIHKIGMRPSCILKFW